MSVVLINKKSNLPEMSTAVINGRISTLPCMPEVLADLLSACLDGADTQKLAEIILQDAPLTAQVIEVAAKLREAPLDAGEPVTAAVQSLGSPMIIGLALQAARRILEFNPTAVEFDFLQQLWRASRFAGQAARCIAPSVNYPYIEEAQLSGLLQNLGVHLLFAQYRDSYLGTAPLPWSCREQISQEQQLFYTDHLKLAVETIDGWNLDSFLADAVRFLFADSRQLLSANPLFRIAALAHLFVSGGTELHPQAAVLGEEYFNLRASETDYLYDWVRGLMSSPGRAGGDQRHRADSFAGARRRLTDQVFLVAGQEAARARLTAGKTPEEVARIGASLYLENSSATCVHFFLLDQRRQELVGLSSIGSSRISRELKIPMTTEAGLAPRALLRNQPMDTCGGEQSMTVTDHLLLRLCSGNNFLCQPLRANGHPLAVAVFGLSSPGDIESVRAQSVRMLHPVISTALAQVAAGDFSRPADGTNLLRRVNHEISSPLTIIGNYAEVLKHSLNDKSVRELTESIKQETRRIDEIVNYYLNQQEMFEFPDQEVDLNQLVQEAVESLRDTELTPRQIAVVYQLQQDLPRPATLTVLIRQILINLLKNAAEAMDNGGEVVLVTRLGYCADLHQFVEICVKDNGPGIPPAIRDRLFRPVVSTKGVGHAGSGLSIVKGMVEDLGARINCHSSPESGTTFYLQIPVVEDHRLLV